MSAGAWGGCICGRVGRVYPRREERRHPRTPASRCWRPSRRERCPDCGTGARMRAPAGRRMRRPGPGRMRPGCQIGVAWSAPAPATVCADVRRPFDRAGRVLMRLFRPRSTAGLFGRFLRARGARHRRGRGDDGGRRAAAGAEHRQRRSRSTAGSSPSRSRCRSAGAPQTILLIGSDHRADEPFKQANTDTMLLVRLNGSSSTINVMSLPRDLEVNIPGHPTNKLNAAYSEGGWNLLIKTIKQNVFPDFVPEPHRRRQLRRLRGHRRRDRLRLLRHRPSLLQPVSARARAPTTSRRSTSSPAIRSSVAAITSPTAHSPSSASATPTPTSFARPDSRTSYAGPRVSTRPAS